MYGSSSLMKRKNPLPGSTVVSVFNYGEDGRPDDILVKWVHLSTNACGLVWLWWSDDSMGSRHHLSSSLFWCRPHTLSPFSKILPWHPAGQNRRIKLPPCSFCIQLLLFLSMELRGRPCVYFHIVSPTHQLELEQAMNPHHLNPESFLLPFFNFVCLCWKVM